MKPILISLLFTSFSVTAATKAPVLFTKSVSSPIGAEQAILASASGEQVYKCQPVEFKVSKSGTSVSLRTKKKQLSKEEIEQQIEELKKRGE